MTPARPRLLVAAATAVLVLVVAVVVVVVARSDRDGGAGREVVRSDGEPGIDPTDVLDRDQVELIRRATPDTSCVGAQEPTPAGAGLVALDVVRVDGSCLTTTTEHVPEDEADERRAAVEREPGVVAAAVVQAPDADRADQAGAGSRRQAPVQAQGDDRRSDQWALDVLGASEGSSELPWPDGSGVVVAVLDSGVDSSHPDLGDAVVARRGFDGQEELDSHPDGHGTHVAGIIGARRDNGGIVGMAPDVGILDVPVRLKESDPDAPSWPVGLVWAVNHGADVVNMSFGKALSRTGDEEMEVMAAALLFTEQSDVVAVASAGNCGCDDRQAPSAFASTVSVGSIQDDLKLSGFSARVDVDLVAPGGGDWMGGVLSTTPGDEHHGMSGTSQAAPHVAGAAAVARFAAPEAPADRVVQALLDTADLDRLDEGQRSRPGVGRGLLDVGGTVEQLRSGSGPEPGTPPAERPRAQRTQAAFVQDGTLFAYDGTALHPVRRVGSDHTVASIQWSADHTQLVGADDTTLFSWGGPGSEVLEVPCEGCGYNDVAYLDDVAVTDPGDGGRQGDLVVTLDEGGTLTRYEAATLEPRGSTQLVPPPPGSDLSVMHGGLGGRLLVSGSLGVSDPGHLTLVDPFSGEADVTHTVVGGWQGRVARTAAGDRLAYASAGPLSGACDDVNKAIVLDGDLRPVADPDLPRHLVFDELFFNGDVLYATLERIEPTADGTCPTSGSAGLWRVRGDTWEQVDAEPLPTARPLEGRSGGEPTGWLVVTGDQEQHLSFEPPGPDDPAGGDPGRVDLGTFTFLGLWTTPTRTEVPWRGT